MKSKEDYASAIMSTNQATDACISDIARLFLNPDYKQIIVDSFTKNNPFKKILPKPIIKSITKDINDMTHTAYDKHIDGVCYDEYCNPKKDVTIQDLIKRMDEYISDTSLRNSFDIRGEMNDEDKYHFIAKRLARTVIAKIMFNSEFSEMFRNILPRPREIYLSTGYTFASKRRIIYKKSIKSPLKILRTPQGNIHLTTLQCAVATCLNICHYSVSLFPISYMVMDECDIIPYTDKIEMFRDSIIDTISTTTDDTLVLRRKGDTLVSAKYIKEIYTLMIKDSFTNIHGKKYPLKDFITDLGMFGEPLLKKVNGTPIKMRLVKSND